MYYTTMTQNIIEYNEVNGSYHMEKEGLVCSVSFLKKKRFRIETIVTDRHKQIAKWVRENMAKTNHYYDIWHIAKCKLMHFRYPAPYMYKPPSMVTQNSTEEET